MLLAAASVLALAGCGTSTGDAGGLSTDRIEGHWVFVSGDSADGPISAMPGHAITLEMDVNGNEGAVGGQGACNNYGVEVAYNGGRIDVGEMTSTLRDCLPEGLVDLDVAYAEALAGVDHAERSDDSLVLTGPQTVLRFAPLPPVKVSEIIGVPWVLDGVVEGDVLAAESPVSSPVGDPAVLEISEDGTLSGSLGCRTFEGDWLDVYGRLVTTRLTTGRSPEGKGCALGNDGPTPLGTQDAAITNVLSSFVPTVDGDRLLLQGKFGQGLVYRRA